MTPLRITLALIIIIVCILLVTACISQPISENRTGNANETVILLSAITTVNNTITTNKNFEESLQTPMGYKENMTPAQQKIPAELLELIDINFQATEKERQNIKTTMITRNQMIPADLVKVKLNLNQSAGQPGEDRVYIFIYVNKSASTHIIDPFVTLVNGWDEKYHFAVAWIDVKNVEKLATLSEVRSIMVVQPAGTDTIY